MGRAQRLAPLGERLAHRYLRILWLRHVEPPAEREGWRQRVDLVEPAARDEQHVARLELGDPPLRLLLSRKRVAVAAVQLCVALPLPIVHPHPFRTARLLVAAHVEPLAFCPVEEPHALLAEDLRQQPIVQIVVQRRQAAGRAHPADAAVIVVLAWHKGTGADQPPLSRLIMAHNIIALAETRGVCSVCHRTQFRQLEHPVASVSVDLVEAWLVWALRGSTVRGIVPRSALLAPLRSTASLDRRLSRPRSYSTVACDA
eukprot:2628492-Prymnesium_polylepis.1